MQKRLIDIDEFESWMMRRIAESEAEKEHSKDKLLDAFEKATIEAELFWRWYHDRDE